jgi:hypothetical protein
MATWQEIQQGIFAGESGGDYNALFGYQNRPGGIFSDVKVSEMSIADILDFTNPSGAYGQFVANTRPDPEMGVATPVGAYQVVGTTLRDAVKALDIDPSQKFDKATQDRIGKYIFETQGAKAFAGYKGPKMDGQQLTAPQMQQMQQQPRGLMGFLRDPRTRQTLASMDVSGLFEGVAEQAGRDIVRQEEQQQRNRTADWLASQEGGELFASAIRAGVPAGQAYEAFRKSKTGDFVVVGKTLVDRRTGKVVFQAPQTASMTRFNPATGQYETISGIDPSQLDLKESESASTIYSGRMQQAQNILDLVEREGTDFYQRIAQNIPLVGNYLTTEEYKSYDQAKRNFINAVLRKESGAAIAESEFENADKQYFPQPGDTPEIIAQKRANRELAIRLMEASAGEGAAYANQQLELLQKQITGDEPVSPPSTSKNTIVD